MRPLCNELNFHSDDAHLEKLEFANRINASYPARLGILIPGLDYDRLDQGNGVVLNWRPRS